MAHEMVLYFVDDLSDMSDNMFYIITRYRRIKNENQHTLAG